MDKNEDENDITEDQIDILIYIQKRLTKLEKECAASLLIVQDLQKQLRNNTTLSFISDIGPFIDKKIHNMMISPNIVTNISNITIPESGMYIISALICLHSYKSVKFQYLSFGGAMTESSYNEPSALANHLKAADKSIRINTTVKLNKGEIIEIDFYHISACDKKIIRSNIEAILLKR